jgi:phosphatidylglycerophosphate synthase
MTASAGTEGGGDSAPREKAFLLARAETRALRFIAERLPPWVLLDHLSALGVVAALGVGACYLLSNESPAWLSAASALLVVHWLGDSLDGTLARVRRIERPRYGYYLDHLTDAFSTVVIGLGLSPYMLLTTALAIVIAYLVMSINVYLEASALHVFRLGYGRARADRGAHRAHRHQHPARTGDRPVPHRRGRSQRLRRRRARARHRDCGDARDPRGAQPAGARCGGAVGAPGPSRACDGGKLLGRRRGRALARGGSAPLPPRELRRALVEERPRSLGEVLGAGEDLLSGQLLLECRRESRLSGGVEHPL